VLNAPTANMRVQADASFQRIDNKNGTNKKSDGDFHTLMTKVESGRKSLQKRAKTNSKVNQKEVVKDFRL
jgi:hypothetical protein